MTTQKTDVAIFTGTIKEIGEKIDKLKKQVSAIEFVTAVTNHIGNYMDASYFITTIVYRYNEQK